MEPVNEASVSSTNTSSSPLPSSTGSRRVWFHLLFDEKLEADIVSLWDVLRANNIGDLGKDYTKGFGERPHITLFPIDIHTDSFDVIVSKTQQLCEGVSPFPISFHSLGCFLSPINRDNNNFVYQLTPAAAPFLSSGGLDLLMKFLSNWESAVPHFSATCWAPHCTLAFRLTESEFLDNFAKVTSLLQLPYSGSVNSISIYDSDKRKYDFICPFK